MIPWKFNRSHDYYHFLPEHPLDVYNFLINEDFRSLNHRNTLLLPAPMGCSISQAVQPSYAPSPMMANGPPGKTVSVARGRGCQADDHSSPSYKDPYISAVRTAQALEMLPSSRRLVIAARIDGNFKVLGTIVPIIHLSDRQESRERGEVNCNLTFPLKKPKDNHQTIPSSLQTFGISP